MREYILLAFTLILLHNSIVIPSSVYAQGSKKSIPVPYPEPLPDSIALTFLANIVSGDSLDFNACFSPDGKSFYFSRSKNRRSKIYVSNHDGTNWTEPVLASFTGTEQYAEADPVFSPDGKLYFISNRPVSSSDSLKDYDIWFVTLQANGTWSQAENLVSVNSDSSEYYISFSKNGNLYFASSRKGGYGEEDIYVSNRVKGQFAKPKTWDLALILPNQNMTLVFRLMKTWSFLLHQAVLIALVQRTCISQNERINNGCSQ
jgi:hypothetical protein